LLLRLIETAYLGNEAFATTEIVLVVVWILVALRPHAGPARLRRVLVATVAIGSGALALGAPTLSRLVFAHAHNLIAVLIWYLLFRRYSGGSLAPLGLILAAAVGLVWLGGSALRYTGGPAWFGMHVDAATNWLAPGVEPSLGRGIVLSYAFLQSVHYGVWLLLIPQEACNARGSTTFAMSLKSAWNDFRPLGLVVIAAGVLSVLGAATLDPVMTSAVYLFVTPFHGYLELVVLASYLASRGPADSFVRPAMARI
jgi:hypothetical protein